MRVGFIGLGVMGGPMAANVLKGGHELTVFDLNPAAVAQLTALGAKAAASPRELGQASEVVITMLPEPQHVEGAILGENGAAAGMAAGGTVIDMSTIDPTTSQRIGQALKARGIAMVDSPVGKTSEHAVTGTLTLMIGGDAADIERVRPVLACMGNQFFICGGQGMGADTTPEVENLATGELGLQAQGVGNVIGAAQVPGRQLKQVPGAHGGFVEGFRLVGIKRPGMGRRQRFSGQGQAPLQLLQLQGQVVRQLAAQIKASLKKVIEGEGGGRAHGCSP